MSKSKTKKDHVVYLDAKVSEFELLLSKKKTMIIRGAAGRKLPYGRVSAGDSLYFVNNNAEGRIKAKAVVKSVFNSEKMNKEESISVVKHHQDKLLLNDNQFNRWAGKRYIVLIEISDFKRINPFEIDKNKYKNMDDWLLVDNIKNVKI